MMYFHVTAMFVNIQFNKIDHILIKNLYRLKGYTTQKLLKDFQLTVRTSQVQRMLK